MEARERAKERLAIHEVLLAVAERGREVVEPVWNSSNDDEASRRMRELVDIPDGLSARLILDQQIRLLTKAQAGRAYCRSQASSSARRRSTRVMQAASSNDPDRSACR